jgi:protein SCO1
MKKLSLLLLAISIVVALAACQSREAGAPAEDVAAVEEQTYDLRGVIISRDPATNQLTVDHEEIPGYMAAMTMPYEVRGQNVAELPADGTTITATVHATDQAYWLTDVNLAAGEPVTDTAATTTDATTNTSTSN